MARGSLRAAVSVLGAAAVAAACGVPDDPNYGPSPGSITHVPLPTSDGGGACTAANYAFKTGDICGKYWNTDIFQKLFTSTGTGTCALTTRCHGGSQAPVMKDGDASGAWDALVGFTSSPFNTSSPKRPYINPCSKDESTSYITANLAGTSGGGVRMPQTPYVFTAQEQADILTWVKCGAPNN